MTPSGTTAASYDDQDRLLSFGDATYSYTPDGELRTKTNPTGTTTYTHDALGSLLAVELPDGRVIDYLVDGQGRRVAKEVDGVIARAWLYRDNLNPIAELDGAGNVVSRFVYASRGNVPDYMIRDCVAYRILSDNLGSPIVVVNTETGEIAQELEYDVWGNVLEDTNPGFQPFGFAGGLFYPDTGLVRFGARDYDPEVGRWTAKDPILFGGGNTNLYRYVLYDRVNFNDPSGLFIWDIIDVFSFRWSLYDFINCPTLENAGWLALDAISFLPLIPSIGLLGKLDDIRDLARLSGRADDAIDLARGNQRAAKTSLEDASGNIRRFMQTGQGSWESIASHIERATSRKARGGVSIVDHYRNLETGEYFFWHSLFKNGVEIDSHIRPLSKLDAWP